MKSGEGKREKLHRADCGNLRHISFPISSFFQLSMPLTSHGVLLVSCGWDFFLF